jgi:uncharacterized protein YecT (DUF1311 family)
MKIGRLRRAQLSLNAIAQDLTPIGVIKFTITLCAFLIATTASAINCARAANPSEIAICSAPKLQGVNGELQNAYNKLSSSLGQLNPISRSDLVQSQRKWILARNQLCGANVECLDREITLRTNWILLTLGSGVPASSPLPRPDTTISPARVETSSGDEMTFRFVENPCYRHCPSTIFAQGVFARDTAEKFAVFILRYPAKVLAFDSNGGDLRAALAMGKKIREARIDTVIHGSDFQACTYGSRGESCAVLKRGPSGCYSACSYAFMGGQVRTVEAFAKFGVHQLKGMNADIGESNAQTMTAVLARYLDLMGIDRRVLDFASLTRADNMRILSKPELTLFAVDNSALEDGNWALKTDVLGEPFAQYVARGSDEVTYTAQMRRVQNGLLIRVAKTIPRSGYTEADTQSIQKTLDSIRERRVNDEQGDSWSIGISSPTGALSIPSREKWRWIGFEKTVLSEVEVPLSAVSTLSRARKITLHAEIPQSLRELDVSVEIGVVGLSDAAKILARLAPR